MSTQIIDPIAEFAAAARAAGLEIHGHIVADGRLHRYQIGDDRKGKRNGWYVLHLDGVPAGVFGSWRMGVSSSWCAKRDDELTPEQIAENKRRMAEARKQREREEALLRSLVKEKAEKLWARAGMVNAKHGYVVRRAIRPVGAKQARNMIVLPLRDIDGELHSLQFIMPDGAKQFLTGGRKKGCFNLIGPENIKDVDVKELYVSEGWATGCSIYEAAGSPVAVCFDAGNLLPVCHTLRGRYPKARIVVCADDDYLTDGNPGLTKAIEAADAVKGLVVKPDFGDKRPDGATDFNDMHQALGLDAVRAVLRTHETNVVDLESRRKEKKRRNHRRSDRRISLSIGTS